MRLIVVDVVGDAIGDIGVRFFIENCFLGELIRTGGGGAGPAAAAAIAAAAAAAAVGVLVRC